MSACYTTPTNVPPRRGFSLTELLVVIGIIVLLIGLLLVALGGVRERAKQTDTESIMRTFGAACEQFQMEHGFYPGIVPERVLAQAGAAAKFTSTENALLHMTGGYRVLPPNASAQETNEYDNYDGQEILLGTGATQWKLKVDINKIGEGPLINGKPYAPYFTISGNEVGVAAGQWNNPSVNVPDLLDSWEMPILYFRRLRPDGPLVGNATASPPPQFTLAGQSGYIGSTALGGRSVNQVYDAGNNVPGSILSVFNPVDQGDLNLARIIEHPALPGQPRGAFMLLSPGPDSVYLSASDGPGTQEMPVTAIQDPTAVPATAIAEYDDVVTFGGG